MHNAFLGFSLTINNSENIYLTLGINISIVIFVKLLDDWLFY